MSTDANLVGKGDFSQNVNQSVDNPDLTVNSANQTVSTDTPAATSAEELSDFRYKKYIDPVTQRIIIPVSEYVDQITSSREKVDEFYAYFLNLIVQHQLSKEFEKSTDPDKGQKISDLFTGLMLMVNYAADFKLGYAPNKPVVDHPESMEGKPVLAEYIDLLQNNPMLYRKVEMLQQWVSSLQNKLRLGFELNNSGLALNNSLEKSLLAIEKMYELSEQKNAELTRQLAKKEAESDIPKTTGYVTLMFNMQGQDDSEVEVLRTVLIDARDAQLKQVLKKITLDETDEAFWLKERHGVIQSLLDQLSYELSTTAETNNYAARYEHNPAFYLQGEKSDRQRLDKRRDEFIDEYSVFTQPDEEEADEESEAATDPVEPTPEPEIKEEDEPIYLRGLTKTQKDIMRSTAETGKKVNASDDDLLFRADWLFRPERLEEHHSPDYFHDLTSHDKRMLWGARFSGAPEERLKRLANAFRNDPMWIREGYRTEEAYNAAQQKAPEATSTEETTQ